MSDEKIGARWEDEAEMAVALEEAAIVERSGTNDYQGCGSFLVHRPGRYRNDYQEQFGVLDWSYGSCGGCDDREDKPRRQVVLEFCDDIKWFNDEAQAREAYAQCKSRHW
jgi:hypothetical protein